MSKRLTHTPSSKDLMESSTEKELKNFLECKKTFVTRTPSDDDPMGLLTTTGVYAQFEHLTGLRLQHLRQLILKLTNMVEKLSKQIDNIETKVAKNEQVLNQLQHE